MCDLTYHARYMVLDDNYTGPTIQQQIDELDEWIIGLESGQIIPLNEGGDPYKIADEMRKQKAALIIKKICSKY